MALKPGDLLRDKYRIDALIGRGGMGHVFAATDQVSREQVAVKVVSRTNVDDVLLVRLHREAEAATRIQSAYVPRVIEVSETDEGETFFAMERLHGDTLSHRIRKGGPLPWEDIFQIGKDILAGLVDAHAAGVVHRDLKPSNVFLARRDDDAMRAMILDFGVCKMTGIDTEQLTGTGESIGTVAYMAPEQVRGAAHVDERADLFGFGVLIFEMVTGRLPHEGPSQMAILASKLESAPLRLRDYARVAIPEGTDELVMRAIERHPEARPGSARELLDAWEALGGATAIQPNPLLEPLDDIAMSVGEAPTEISHPPSSLIALSATGEARIVSDDIDVHAILPASDLHPTQTALSTHYTSIHRKSGVVRGALVLACAALVGGLAVVVVTVSRTQDTRAAASAVASEGVIPVASSSVVAPEAATPPTEESAVPIPALTVEPEATGAIEPVPPGRGAKSRSRERRHHRAPAPAPAVSAAPKASGPRITSEPRY